MRQPDGQPSWKRHLLDLVLVFLIALAISSAAFGYFVKPSPMVQPPPIAQFIDLDASGGDPGLLASIEDQRCGVALEVRVPAAVYANEPFTLTVSRPSSEDLPWLVPRAQAAAGNPACPQDQDFGVHVDFLPKGIISLSPEGQASLAAVERADSGVGTWSALSSRGGTFQVTLSITGQAGLLWTATGGLNVGDSRREGDARTALNEKLEVAELVARPSDGQLLRPGRSNSLDLTLTGPAVPAAPGMAPTATLQMCTQVLGAAAAAEEHCTETQVELARPLTETQVVAFEVPRPGEVRVATRIALTTRVDGQEVAAGKRYQSVGGQASLTVSDRAAAAGRQGLAISAAIGGVSGGVLIILWLRRMMSRSVATEDAHVHQGYM